VLAIPDQDEEAYKQMYGNKEWKFDCNFKVQLFEEGELDPHVSALYCRCCADEICQGELIAHVDSDCVFVAPTDPEIYLDTTFGVKPILLHTPFELRDGKPWPSHWQACTSEALGFVVEQEVMRRHPSIYWAKMLPEFRQHILQIHGKDLYEYLLPRKRHGLGAGTFSEFTAMGGYAFYFWHNRYRWIPDGPERPPDHLHQFWSFHTVHNEEVQAKLREFGLLE
jgi:hypothetical protein